MKKLVAGVYGAFWIILSAASAARADLVAPFELEPGPSNEVYILIGAMVVAAVGFGVGLIVYRLRKRKTKEATSDPQGDIR